MTAAATLLGDPRCGPPWIVTAEHASPTLPLPLAPADAGWLQTHWGWDPGVAAIAQALVPALPAAAVLATFSRLWIDANREPSDPFAARRVVEDHPLSWNAGLDAVGHAARVAGWHAPYHAAIDATIVAAKQARPDDRPPWLLSLHSFTPSLGASPRWMEFGVLFDRYDGLAMGLATALRDEGAVVAANAPYSAKDGLNYSPRIHGSRHAIPYLELEVRQDLVADDASTARVAALVGRALARLRQSWDAAGRVPAP